MKKFLLVPRMYIREVLAYQDAHRMLASGSWARAEIPKPNTVARRQREFRRRRAAGGYRKFEAIVPPELYVLLNSLRADGESTAQLLQKLCDCYRVTGVKTK